jgi:phosphonate transport system substrate-binding protein
MRRWVIILVVLVAAVFVVVAIPGSPVAKLLAGLLAGEKWERLSDRPANGGPPAAAHPVLRAAVGAMITPQRAYQDYRRLYEVIAERTGRQLELVQRKTYAELNDLLATGEVDMAWVCTGAIPDLAQRRAARLLAVPVVNRRTGYQAYFIVHRSSGISTMEELRGTVFAFTDPLSLTGRRVMVEWIAQWGDDADSFFERTFFTHAHDNSIRAVRDGLAAAACVDSLVYDYLATHSPEEIADLRIIRRSKRYPIPPIVTPASVEEPLFQQLQSALLEVHLDPVAKKCLEELDVDAFVEGDDSLYFGE